MSVNSTRPGADTGGIPYLFGQPLAYRHYEDLQFVPVQGNLYRLQTQRSGTVLDVTNSTGGPWLIDLGKLQ